MVIRPTHLPKCHVPVPRDLPSCFSAFLPLIEAPHIFVIRPFLSSFLSLSVTSPANELVVQKSPSALPGELGVLVAWKQQASWAARPWAWSSF